MSIQKIETSAFTQYNSTIEELYLSQNLLEDIPWSAIKELKFLKKLNLEKNRISTLEKEHFLGMDDLSYLKLSENRITHIDSDGLCSSLKLQHLVLDKNPLTSAISLGRCQYIGQLTLRECSLKTFPGLTYRNGTVITIGVVSFKDNMLHFLDAAAFRKLNVTGSVSLSNNKLTDTAVSSEVWKPLGNLRSLILYNNSIERIPSGYFRYMLNLRNLYLAKNKIFVLDPGSFSGLSKLEFLDINDNNVSVLPPGVFKGLIAVRDLRMEGNQISHIHKEAFLDLHALKVLHLKENNIHSITFLLPGPNVYLILMRNPITCSCSLLEVTNASFTSSSTCIHQNCSVSPINQLPIEICDTIPMNRTAVEQCLEKTTVDCILSHTCGLESQSSNFKPRPGMLIKLLLIHYVCVWFGCHANI